MTSSGVRRVKLSGVLTRRMVMLLVVGAHTEAGKYLYIIFYIFF